MAAVIIEPVAANMGVILPKVGFLHQVVDRARTRGALVIFDEVITGFRLTYGGYQSLCGIAPDLTTLGKIIGGGMPIGAVGGKAAHMEQLAPLGPVYQAGTLSGNPVSVAAGRATLGWLRRNDPYATLDERTGRMVGAIVDAASAAGHALQMPRLGSLFSLFHSKSPVMDFDDVMNTDRSKFSPLFHALLQRDVYLAPSPFEAGFLSTAHSDEVVDRVIDAFNDAFLHM
jgi:glutamate-1-semialdehyde 2,1-aminomutase